MKKKYKMAVGVCPPHILYTDIIIAESAEEAVRQYLDGKEVSEESFLSLCQRMQEIPEAEVRDPGKDMEDAFGKEFQVGDKVAALCTAANNRIKFAVVKKVTTRTAFFEAEDGTVFKLVASCLDGFTQDKVIKLSDAMLERDGQNDGPKDAIGNALEAGQSVAYRLPTYLDTCPGFGVGTVLKVTSSMVLIDSKREKEPIRKKHDLVIVLK